MWKLQGTGIPAGADSHGQSLPKEWRCHFWVAALPHCGLCGEILARQKPALTKRACRV
jgi:hypothetical protein